MVFAFMAASNDSAAEALILARSIRRFGGALARSPIWVLFPEGGSGRPPVIGDELISLNARLIPFSMDDAARRFPFAAKVHASAEAESLAQGKTGLLVWMDSDSIVIREPLKSWLEVQLSIGDNG